MPPRRQAPLQLGALEQRVMELVWQVGDASVRDVAHRLGDRLAYTTVMTTLDRLFKKGLLARTKDGNAFVYRPALSREEFHRRSVERAVGVLLSSATEPVLAGFVDAAAALDEANLARLEALIAERRRRR